VPHTSAPEPETLNVPFEYAVPPAAPTAPTSVWFHPAGRLVGADAAVVKFHTVPAAATFAIVFDTIFQ